MLSTGEVAEYVGYGVTRRMIDRLVRDEKIPYFRLGSGWVQVPRWVADELIRRAQRQLDLRSRLGALAGAEGPEAEAERDGIRRELDALEGPIVDPEINHGT